MKYILSIIIFSFVLVYNFVQCHDFSIGGDFNGDGETDVIKIKYQSKDTKTDLPTITYESTEEKRTKYCELNPQLILFSETGLSTLLLSDSCNCSGPIQLMNLGDLNGNGGDEIAILLDGFYESAPYFQVYTYCNNSWHLVNNFKNYYKDEFGEYMNIENLIKHDKDYVSRWYIDENGNLVEIMTSNDGC
jgi:hypothetical protein